MKLKEHIVAIPGTPDAVSIKDAVYGAFVDQSKLREIVYAVLGSRNGETFVLVRTAEPGQPQHRVGETLEFTLEANAMRSRGGKKLPFDKDDEEGRLEWLRRQGSIRGFDVVNAVEIETRSLIVKNSKHDRRIPISKWFGTLVVTDAEAFAKAMAEGIGRGKCWGLGCLRVEPFFALKAA